MYYVKWYLNSINVSFILKLTIMTCISGPWTVIRSSGRRFGLSVASLAQRCMRRLVYFFQPFGLLYIYSINKLFQIYTYRYLKVFFVCHFLLCYES